jgi:hypothetical protein
MREFRLLRIAIIVAAIGGLIGCAGERKAFDATATPEISRVVLLPAGQPTTYSAMGGNPLLVLGLAGAIVGSKIEETTHSAPFTEAARSQGVDLGTALTMALEEEMTKVGRNVVSVTATSSRPEPNAFFRDYKSFVTGGDEAVLDAAIDEAGYRATLILPFRPYMRVIVRLVTPATNQTIYADRFEVDPTAGTVGFRLIGRPDLDCSFETRDKLMANAQKAGECLGKEAAMIARAIVADLPTK